jgi:hypothetical protein
MPTQTSRLPLKRKLEKTILAFIKAAGSARLKALSGLEGHDNVEPELPYYVVYCGTVSPHEDLPAETGVKMATVVIHLKTEANDEARSAADSRLREIEDTALAPVNPNAAISDENKMGGAFMAFANKPANGADTRAIIGLHIYDLFPSNDADSMDGSAWHDQIALSIVAQDFDSH